MDLDDHVCLCFRVSRRKLALTGVLWLGFVGLYAWDYRIGVAVLLALSLAHVVLEFPLNHLTFIHIGGELRQLLASKPARAAGSS